MFVTLLSIGNVPGNDNDCSTFRLNPEAIVVLKVTSSITQLTNSPPNVFCDTQVAVYVNSALHIPVIGSILHFPGSSAVFTNEIT